MRKSGFTIIEVTISSFIFTVGILGVFALVQLVTSYDSIISSRLRAIYLAQEGIENIRGTRDSNWLAQRYNPAILWDQGIATGDWQAIDKFQRKITINKPQTDQMTVSIQVRWPERGGMPEVTAETELYNWR